MTEQVPISASKLTSSRSSCSIRPITEPMIEARRSEMLCLIEMQLSPAPVEQQEDLSDPKHERDFVDVVILCDTVWKMGGEKGVNISGIGPHGPSLAEFQA